MLAGLLLACWLMGILAVVGLVPLAGSLRLSLYALFGTAAACGWLAGNLYVRRTRELPAEHRRWLRTLYLFGPMGLLFVLRAMAPAADQVAAPLVPLYSFGVFGALFLVPVLLRPPSRRGPRIG
jgi:hypothetical protein